MYMEKPTRFMKYSTLYCRFKNSLYSLNQAPLAWYEKIDWFFVNIGLKCCEYNHSVYGNKFIVVVYVDDWVLTINKSNLIFRLKRQLADNFEMIDLDILNFLLGHQVLPLSNGIFIFWSKYAVHLLKWFNKDDYKACDTPYQFIVKLTRDYQSRQVNARLYC